MTEPRVSFASGTPNSGRDSLLATKLSFPRIRRDLLARPHLLGRLDEAMAHELVLVSTPAGFGKTTLLAEWARTREWPAAWLSLDDDDNDPTRFWRYLVAAADHVHSGIAERILSLIGAPEQPTSQAVVTALVNELTAYTNEAVLILDDYHTIESRVVHDGLALLLERLPPGLHVVIASRSDPPLLLSRLRARGQLA